LNTHWIGSHDVGNGLGGEEAHVADARVVIVAVPVDGPAKVKRRGRAIHPPHNLADLNGLVRWSNGAVHDNGWLAAAGLFKVVDIMAGLFIIVDDLAFFKFVDSLADLSFVADSASFLITVDLTVIFISIDNFPFFDIAVDHFTGFFIDVDHLESILQNRFGQN
jgi:hypothetical protein